MIVPLPGPDGKLDYLVLNSEACAAVAALADRLSGGAYEIVRTYPAVDA